MSDLRDLLEQERRRFAMPGDPFRELERRRDRKRRNRRIASGLVALVIAVVGVGGGLYAFRTGDSVEPATSPSASIGPPAPSPSETGPSPAPPVGNLAVPPVSGPIQFIDAQHGWMVDGEGQILATTDAGHTWEVQLSGPSTVTAVDMLDAHHGWGVFEGGLLITNDGGAHWDTWSNQPLTTIQFVTPEVGWGVEATDQPVGRLMATVDAGRTWTPAAASLPVNSVCFSDPVLGWAAGPSEGGVSLFKTEDGGDSWTETGIGLAGGDSVGYQATVRCGGTEAWILVTGDGGAGHIAYAVLRTIPGVGSQPVITSPVLQDAFTHPLGEGKGIPEASNPQPGPFAAVDGSTARVITWCPPCGDPNGAYVSLERTDDGGTTWTDPTVVDAGHPGEPLGISFLDQGRGWILLHDSSSNTDIVLTTSDGGLTWQQP
jgi:photosystem II stability/assembly factor-like uncharacterized protein